jgi:hypothetical protein
MLQNGSYIWIVEANLERSSCYDNISRSMDAWIARGCPSDDETIIKRPSQGFC